MRYTDANCPEPAMSIRAAVQLLLFLTAMAIAVLARPLYGVAFGLLAMMIWSLFERRRRSRRLARSRSEQAKGIYDSVSDWASDMPWSSTKRPDGYGVSDSDSFDWD
ncbi:hypothetical protein GJV26_16600 [Massilia dura]|uniref:Uncharacterized protein n=1 Tax=Pseudoduganella dura TaxID=321982 RepID=A0A6I3XI42_9BURK|nr:hypothetical protein [Pseudoduganella dura]MUI14063.1 hypothetical protein [Pseudoduganella dura]GGX92242.1 hypothetical protein GCM10007386_24090 [Pseudoduganella dura]